MTYKLLIADFAWTLAIPQSGSVFRSPGETWVWMEGIKEALEFLHKEEGLSIAVEQQEGGIAAGYVEYHESREAVYTLLSTLSFPVPFLMCPYSWLGEKEQENPYRAFKPWRKPSPVALLLLASQFPGIAQTEVLVIGDRTEDERCANAAGFDYRDAADYFYNVWEAMGAARPEPAPLRAQEAPEDIPF